MRIANLAFLACCISLRAGDPNLQELLDQGRIPECRQRVENWIKQQPKEPYALLWMSKLKTAMGERKAAHELAVQALRAKPDDANMEAQMAIAMGDIADDLPITKIFGTIRKIKAHATRAVTLAPGHRDALCLLATLGAKLPAILGGGKSLLEKSLAQLVVAHPGEGHMMKARIAVQASDFSAAEQSLREAARLEPKNPRVARMQAELFLFEGHRDPAKALMYAQTCLTQDPEYPSGLATMAKVMAYQERWTELTPWLNKALIARPGDYGPHLAVASSLKDLNRSEPLYQQILAAPEGIYAYRTWNVHFEYGKSLKKAGRMQEAILHLEKAAALNDVVWVISALKDAKKRAAAPA